LALVASLDILLDVGFKGQPPEAVEQGMAHRVKALVAEFIVCIMNEHVLHCRAGIKLMSAIVLSLPNPSACYEKMVGSADKMCELSSR
jgi:hypothetical protein